MMHYLLNKQSVRFHYQRGAVFSSAINTSNGGKIYTTVYRSDGVETNVHSLKEILTEFETSTIQENGGHSIKISLGLSEDEISGIKIEGKVLGMLHQASFLKQQVKVTLTLHGLKRFHLGFQRGNWEQLAFVSTSTKEMDICTSAESGEVAFCIDANFDLPYSVEQECEEWRRSNGNCKFDLILSVKLSVFGEKHSKTQTDIILRKMLHESISSDLIIVTGDGKEIPCHKGILGANSPVLKAMFENEMKESITGRIEMGDMSETDAKAFLEFVYYREISAAVKDSSVALELLQAGEKYAINDLKDAMKNIFLLNNQSSWWTLDVTVRLFLFASKIETDSSLLSRILPNPPTKRAGFFENLFRTLFGNPTFQYFCSECAEFFESLFPRVFQTLNHSLMLFENAVSEIFPVSGIFGNDSSGAISGDLKQKSIKILKRNYGYWKGSESFQDFCKDEPQALAELLDGALTFLN